MKTRKIHLLIFCITICLLAFTGISSAQTTPPPGEEKLFSSATDPDALLLLDLSGSMVWNPGGDDSPYGSSTSCVSDTVNCLGSPSTYYTYASNASCTADTVKCTSPGSTYYTYAHDSSCTPDAANCPGSGSSTYIYAATSACTADSSAGHCTTSPYKYARSSSCAANTSYCTGSGCSGGFCSTAKSGCNVDCSSDCSGGYCKNPRTGCNVNCDCSGGYCHTSRTGCNVVCNAGDCSGGFCHSSQTDCNVDCSNCSGGFCTTSRSTCNTDCSRISIAKRAIAGILNSNNTGTSANQIDSSDETNLTVRLGYMRYRNCGTGSGEATGTYNYTTGCNTLIAPINTSFSCVFCSNKTSCSTTASACDTGTNKCSNANCVAGESAVGGTPLAASLYEAKKYLDDHKALDTSSACRKKFVILLTDGSDTLACGADGSECNTHRYKNRREVVARAKELGDAGYKVFVIGFGANMPPYLKNTLNWAAYYGGTDNPNDANSGNTTAYVLSSGCDPSTNPTACCNVSSNPTACYPSGVSQCAADSSTATAACFDSSYPYPGVGNSTSNYMANAYDPGFSGVDAYGINLSGYAFITADATALDEALRTAINIIKEATYSFSQASIQASRTKDEDFLYEASFEPITNEPFWHGHLKKFPIDTVTGQVGSMLLDAADVLQAKSASTRMMYTCTGCTTTLTTFDTSISPTYFGVALAADRDAIVNYLRGEKGTCPGASCTNPDFTAGGVYKNYTTHTCGSVTINANAFGRFRCDHQRTTANGKRFVVVGANDGQVHAFKTSDMSEAWSFIPPNLLSKLKNITHNTHPTGLTHQYFADGPISAADVWLGSGDGKSKNSSAWKTVMVFGEGRGSASALWSTASTCDADFSDVYYNSMTGVTYPYYCGYFALDVTDSVTSPPPTFLWHIGGTSAISSAHAAYLGDPWSKMIIDRVIYNDGGSEVEKWVGILGGGYNGNDCTGGGACADTRGKGVFVIDLSNGQILWSYTYATDTNMQFSFPAAAKLLDTDNDGFTDTAYIGDLGGNMWRFNFCKKADMPSCSISGGWTGVRLFNGGSLSATERPIYTIPSAAWDGAGNLWVYWGTGNKADPTAKDSGYTYGKLFALMDNNRTSTSPNVIPSQMQDITLAGLTFNQSATNNKGYYITMSQQGEKILADPTVFGGVVYFTSYVPNTDPCGQSGDAYLYSIVYTSGAGAAFGSCPGGSTRSQIIATGSGMASAPVISVGKSGVAGLYVTTSSGVGGSGSTSGGTSSSALTGNMGSPGGMPSPVDMIYWRDRRLQ
jgi:Tfp pilus tip-associated adhesin PilY1